LISIRNPLCVRRTTQLLNSLFPALEQLQLRSKASVYCVVFE